MRGIARIQQTERGIEVLCDCGAETTLVIAAPDYDALEESGDHAGIIDVPATGGDVAFTCAGCRSVHWLTFAPLEVAP